MECGREKSPHRFREQNKNNVLGSRPKPTPSLITGSGWADHALSPRSRDLLVPLSRVRSVLYCVDFCANNLLVRPSVVRCSMDRRHPHCDIVVDEFMTRRPSFPWPVSASGQLVLGGGGTIPNSRCPFVFLSHGYGSIVIRAWVRGTVLLCYAGRRLPHLTKPIAIPRPSTIPDSSNRPQPDRQATNGERNCQTPRRCCWDMVVIRTAHFLLCVSLCLSDGIPLFDPWHGFA